MVIKGYFAPAGAREARTANVRLWTMVALAFLFGLTQASGAVAAENKAQMLEVSPTTGAVRLAAAGDADELLRTLEIERGKSVFVRTDYDVKRVSVGDSALVDVVVLNPRELQFVAKATGSTNVLIWDTRGRPQASIEQQDSGPGTQHLPYRPPAEPVRMEGHSQP